MLKLIKNYFFLLFYTGLLVACVHPASKSAAEPAVTQPTEPVQVSPANKSTAAVKVMPIKSNDAVEYLTFAEDFSNLTADAQKQALTKANQALTINSNDLLHRMQLVMIYGLPSSSLLDSMKAQQLLQNILQEDILANSQLAFANILFDYLMLVNKPSKTLNGEPKRVESLQQKNEALQNKLDVTQQKLDAAQQKLDELRKIEKLMGEREALPKN